MDYKGNLKMGSVVIVTEDNILRLQWPLARVFDFMPTKDGYIRSVKLKTTKGVCVRPVQRLHLLENGKEEELVSENCEMTPVITKRRKVKSTKADKSVKPI